MAIQTINATIQMRKGNEPDFEPDQMTAGEWAVSTDTKKVWMCFAPGIVRRMATYEAFEEDMQEIQSILATCQDIQEAVEAFEQLAGQHASQAESWSVTAKSWAVGGTGTRTGENADNSKYYYEQSKNIYDNMSQAGNVTGVKGDNETSYRGGNVNLTPENIGAIATDGDASAATVTFSQATALANVQSGDSMATALGKLAKLYSELESGNMPYWLLAGGKLIPANSDLDTYREAGNYYCATSTNAKTLVNCPTKKAFNMKVFADTASSATSPWKGQMIQEFGTGIMWYRTTENVGGVYSYKETWEKVTPSLANNLTTTAEGYALDARVGPVIDVRFEDIESDIAELNGKIADVRIMSGSHITVTVAEQEVTTTGNPYGMLIIPNKNSLFGIVEISYLSTGTNMYVYNQYKNDWDIINSK